MILDAESLFSNEQAVTATADSTNVIHVGARRDIAIGTDLFFFVHVPVTATAAGAATVTFALVTASDLAFTAPTTLATSGAIGKAELVQGTYAWIGKLPYNVEEYLKLTYTVATGPLTAGKFTAGLTNGLNLGVTPDSALTI